MIVVYTYIYIYICIYIYIYIYMYADRGFVGGIWVRWCSVDLAGVLMHA